MRRGPAKSKKSVNRRRSMARPLTWAGLKKKLFPGYFTVTFDYFATGEGITRGILMCYSADIRDLRFAADRDFDEFFAHGAEIRLGCLAPASHADLVPAGIQQKLR